MGQHAEGLRQLFTVRAKVAVEIHAQLMSLPACQSPAWKVETLEVGLPCCPGIAVVPL
jgi:hypothetical protein